MTSQELKKKLENITARGQKHATFSNKNALAKVSNILIAVSLLESIHYWIVLIISRYSILRFLFSLFTLNEIVHLWKICIFYLVLNRILA